MDRNVKERLVGATILLVLLVLIVPELLSGPKIPVAKIRTLPASGATESIRNVTVDLTTRKATAADIDTAAAGSAPGSGAGLPDADSASVAPADSATGSPATAPAVARAAAPTITTLKAQQQSDAPLVDTEAPPPKYSGPSKVVAAHAASHPYWAVQLGSFASRINAESLVRQLKAHEVPAYVLSSGKGTKLRFKVRIGPLADRAAAERLRLKLAKDGHAGRLVAP